MNIAQSHIKINQTNQSDSGKKGAVSMSDALAKSFKQTLLLYKSPESDKQLNSSSLDPVSKKIDENPPESDSQIILDSSQLEAILNSLILIIQQQMSQTSEENQTIRDSSKGEQALSSIQTPMESFSNDIAKQLAHLLQDSEGKNLEFTYSKGKIGQDLQELIRQLGISNPKDIDLFVTQIGEQLQKTVNHFNNSTSLDFQNEPFENKLLLDQNQTTNNKSIDPNPYLDKNQVMYSSLKQHESSVPIPMKIANDIFIKSEKQDSSIGKGNDYFRQEFPRMTEDMSLREVSQSSGPIGITLPEEASQVVKPLILMQKEVGIQQHPRLPFLGGLGTQPLITGNESNGRRENSILPIKSFSNSAQWLSFSPEHLGNDPIKLIDERGQTYVQSLLKNLEAIEGNENPDSNEKKMENIDQLLQETDKSKGSAVIGSQQLSGTYGMSNSPKAGVQLPVLPITDFVPEISNWAAMSIRNVQGQTGSMETSFSLYPEHLGPIKIKITTEQGKIEAQILIEHIQAKEVLESQLPNLKQALQQHGLLVQKLEIIQQPQTALDPFQTNLSFSQGGSSSFNGQRTFSSEKEQDKRQKQSALKEIDTESKSRSFIGTATDKSSSIDFTA